METFVPLRIETISPDTAIYFNLFIFFKEQYLLYMEPGATIDEEKLQKLRTQQVARFFIKAEEQFEYQKYLHELLQAKSNDANVAIDEKVDFVEAAASTAVEGMQQDPSTAASYQIAQNTAKGLRQIVAQNPDALKKIFGKTSAQGEQVVKHCMNVSALAGKLAQVTGLDEKETDDLCTAALIHDIGFTKLPREDKKLFDKHRKKFTPDDTRLYNFHVKNAESMLKSKDWVSVQVLDLVLNHEEVRAGTGPMRKKKLSLAEEILSLCNCYDKRLLTMGVTAKEVLKSMEIEEVGNYDLKLIKAFKKMLIQEGLVE